MLLPTDVDFSTERSDRSRSPRSSVCSEILRVDVQETPEPTGRFAKYVSRLRVSSHVPIYDSSAI